MMARAEAANRLMIAPMMAGAEERNRIVWPRKTLTDSSAREDFYVRRRFKRPRSEERLDTVDLRRSPILLVDLYGSPFPGSVSIDGSCGSAAFR